MSNSVSARHILVKYSGSRNPTSWLDPSGNDRIRRTTKEEAVSRLKQIVEKLQAGERFEVLASKYSDCGSARNGGDLGEFGRGMMQKPFEDATFALKVC